MTNRRYVVTDRLGQIWFGEVNSYLRNLNNNHITLMNARQAVNSKIALDTVFFKVGSNTPYPHLIPGVWTNVAVECVTLQWVSSFRVADDAESTALSDRPVEDQIKYGLDPEKYKDHM